MSVRVRFAPSPTGLLHIGGVRTALFNWLYAVREHGQFLLRIENTDTNREVQEAAEQIQRSLRWLGLDWDGAPEFQLDRIETHREAAHQLLAAGLAYSDDGAIRFRMPDQGFTSWDDAIKGRLQYPNDKLEDVVLIRSDGRPTYNLAAALDDADSGITHVIRGEDHVPNTPKQVQILQALERPLPIYAHVPNVYGADGKKLSKRHGAVSVEEFRDAGYWPDALRNYLALLGLSHDDDRLLMHTAELVQHFALSKVSRSPAVFDYPKLRWMNGMYLRSLPEPRYADELVHFLGPAYVEWDGTRIRRAAPLVQEKITTFGEFPDFAGFLFERRIPPPELIEGSESLILQARMTLAEVDPFESQEIESALRGLADRLGKKPRDAFGPIRAAVTGSRVSPGLFESLELLGRDESLARLDAALAVAA